jgi:chromosome segregation ATPase
VAAVVAALAGEEPNPVDSMSDEELADPFKEVIKMIDDLIAELETEEGDDLKTKEQCEKERMENTQDAKKVAKEIDTNVETIDRLTAQIEAANKTIQEIKVEIQGLEVDLRDAGDNRAKENKEYMAAESEDMAAVELVGNAMGVLEKFYEEAGLKFTQLAAVRRVKQEPFVAGGEAPTPPPAGFDDYSGGSRQSQGVIAMLTMIKEDIEKDIAKAKKQEEEAQAAYDKLVEDIEASIKAKEQTVSDLEGDMASDSEMRTTENTTMADNQGQLKAVMDYLKEIAPGCDFIAMNFNIRLTNRQMEVDGLKKAKAILQGAEFS